MGFWSIISPLRRPSIILMLSLLYIMENGTDFQGPGSGDLGMMGNLGFGPGFAAAAPLPMNGPGFRNDRNPEIIRIDPSWVGAYVKLGNLHFMSLKVPHEAQPIPIPPNENPWPNQDNSNRPKSRTKRVRREEPTITTEDPNIPETTGPLLGGYAIYAQSEIQDTINNTDFEHVKRGVNHTQNENQTQTNDTLIPVPDKMNVSTRIKVDTNCTCTQEPTTTEEPEPEYIEPPPKKEDSISSAQRWTIIITVLIVTFVFLSVVIKYCLCRRFIRKNSQGGPRLPVTIVQPSRPSGSNYNAYNNERRVKDPTVKSKLRKMDKKWESISTELSDNVEDFLRDSLRK